MNKITIKETYQCARRSGFNRTESAVYFALPMGIENLLNNIKQKIGPEIIIDKEKKEVRLVKEGIFGNNITETYYTLKGYRIFREEL